MIPNTCVLEEKAVELGEVLEGRCGEASIVDEWAVTYVNDLTHAKGQSAGVESEGEKKGEGCTTDGGKEKTEHKDLLCERVMRAEIQISRTALSCCFNSGLDNDPKFMIGLLEIQSSCAYESNAAQSNFSRLPFFVSRKQQQ